MEKSEFRMLIKHYFLLGETLLFYKLRLSSINIIRTLLRRMEWFRSGSSSKLSSLIFPGLNDVKFFFNGSEDI